jgi:hypothetical protein
VFRYSADRGVKNAELILCFRGYVFVCVCVCIFPMSCSVNVMSFRRHLFLC